MDALGATEMTVSRESMNLMRSETVAGPADSPMVAAQGLSFSFDTLVGPPRGR